MRILVDGDSWAYTWNPQQQLTQHQGFADLLRQRGWSVDCQAEGGCSNSRSVSRVLRDGRLYDLVIWIQTEPQRDWFTAGSVLDPLTLQSRQLLDVDRLIPQVQAQGSLNQFLTRQLRDHCYAPLNSLGKPVWLIGGCSKVAESELERFHNLTAVIPSVSELLFTDFSDCLYQDTHQWASREYADQIMALGDVKLIREWYAVTSDINRKLHRWGQDQQYFNPDKWHPNIQGHERICDLLDQRLRGLSV